jgi:hypothetical protein
MMEIHVRTHFCLSTAIDDGPGTLVGLVDSKRKLSGMTAGCEFVPPFHSNDGSFLSKYSDDEAGTEQCMCHCLWVAPTMELSRTTNGTFFSLTNTILVNVLRIKMAVLTCESTNVYFHAVSLQQKDW